MRRSFRGGTVTLKHINTAGTWPSGNPRRYYRPVGVKAIALPDLPIDHPKFLEAYAAAAGLSAPPDAPVRTGSIAAAVIAFMRSDVYLGVADSTRAVWRRALDDIRARGGKGTLTDLRDVHIRDDLSRLAPNPSRQRLKVWRAFLGWCAEVGLIRQDPTVTIRQRRAPKSDGHTPWTRDDLALFRDHWPIGTQQRLCCEIIAWSGARMCDTVRLGDGNVAGGVLRFVQVKTTWEVAIPMTSPPRYAEADGMLQQCLDARSSRALVWLVTEAGASRSHKSASQWFSAACRKAGLSDGKTAHGLRKLRAAIMRENGATAAQRAAWLGQKSEKQEAIYSQSADLMRVIMGTDQGQPVPTFAKTSNSQS